MSVCPEKVMSTGEAVFNAVMGGSLALFLLAATACMVVFAVKLWRERDL